MRRNLGAPLAVVFALMSTSIGVARAALNAKSPDGIWTGLSPADLEGRKSADAEPGVRPSKFRAFSLDAAALEPILSRAVFAVSPDRDAPTLDLPLPDGGFERFALVRTRTMHPDLERRMAELGWPMKTYRGESLARKGVVAHLDWGGPEGFHAMVAAPGGSLYVDPYWRGDRTLYVSYAKSDFDSPGKRFACSNVGTPNYGNLSQARASTGGNLRTYRLAVAATGEYTAKHGGTKVGGQAAIATTVHRINLVYELEASISLSLVANNIDLVFTDPATDGYTNGDTLAMVDENQTQVDTIIGSGNYDLGHVFGTGAGGYAPGDACSASKAKGATTGDPTAGNPFDIDYVAHEIGHQFGGSHTWNGTSGACSANAFSATTAYEVGSGSTIMGYAKICGADNLQSFSDDNFHGVSLDEILAFATGGGACSSNGSAGNPNEPTVNAGANYTIPMGTPFELTPASSGDADGDILTYSWEEFDLGTQAPLSAQDDGTQPIFRAFAPTPEPTRVFPRLDKLLQNMASTGETLPVTNRTMTFRVTVRDNHAGGGRVGADSMTVTSTTSSGPFRIVSPNGGEQVTGIKTVTWSVANTTAAPVSAAQVDILLSVDGGLTYPITLKSATPNDGSEDVDFTGHDSAIARLKIKATGNVFFDLSDGEFKIGNPQPHLLVLLDRTGSMVELRSNGHSRCRDALDMAKQDVRSFFARFSTIPGISVAVWTFAGSAPSDLTGGFVGEGPALAVLNALGEESCTDSTPLADAICSAADSLDAAFPSGSTGDKFLAISSDGGENNSTGPCSGPYSTSGAPYDPASWQGKVRARLVGHNIVLSRFWGSVVRRPIDIETGRTTLAGSVSDFDFFRELALATGGTYWGVGDGEPLPDPIFGPVPPDPSVVEVPTLSGLGLAFVVAALGAAGLLHLRRRRRTA